mgnify:CR=1 FL=1
MPAEIDVEVYRTDKPIHAAHEVRRSVFVEGQDVPEAHEFDGNDQEAILVVARVNNEVVGTARFRSPEPGVGNVEKVAVREAHRGTGVGRAIMERMDAIGREEGVSTLSLHAQTHAEEFYEKLGYETVSDVYMQVDIPHVTMEKQL